MIPKSTCCRGYATLCVVCALAFLMIGMLTFSLKGNLNSVDAQRTAQVKQDYSQKEDAILSALIHLVPNKAIGAMKRGSANTASSYTWEAIFRDALAMANAEQAANSQLLNSLNLGSSISANTGDAMISSITSLVQAPVKTYAGGTRPVNGGNWWEYHMLGDTRIGPYIPAALELSYDDYLLDMKYPLVTKNKRYIHWYSKGLLASADQYPLYNLIPYPDIAFGYRRPGEPFVAKRNWWVFSLTFGKAEEAKTGIPAVTKDYVLSIYEVPSQLPLSASTVMKLGKFADGMDWQNVTIDGSVYADDLQTEGTVSITDGTISARNSINLSNSTTVAGEAIESDFNRLGGREERGLHSPSDFYNASTAGNVGKVAFIPLNPGNDFLKRSSDGPRSERISPTGWNEYTRGANQTAMRLEAHALIGVELGLPIAVRLHYKDTSGGTRYKDFIRGLNWPVGVIDLPSAIPFQSELLPNLRNALVLHLDRFPEFLNTLPYAAGADVNNSIYIEPNFVLPILIPDLSLLNTELSVSIRGGRDLTIFPKGFSVVTNLRVYMGETTNVVSTTPPPNSGFPPNEVYYPPFSVFSNEKRFGESIFYQPPITLRGQLSSLKTGTTQTFNPLELKNAWDHRVRADDMDVDLVAIKSPAELPPIHLMNWLVTVEEVQ